MICHKYQEQIDLLITKHLKKLWTLKALKIVFLILNLVLKTLILKKNIKLKSSIKYRSITYQRIIL